MAFLDDILRRKRSEIAERRSAVPDRILEARLASAPRPRSLRAALSAPSGPLRIIAEVKRASPSVGAIAPQVDAPTLTGGYARDGAAAISVLTDGPGFGGSLDDLRSVRAQVTVPVLRKDFILDRYQLLEAREAGADAVLLIVAALDPAALRGLLSQAHELGLEALVEIHAAEELPIALAAGAQIIGVNNRDLRSFQVNLAVSEALVPRIPPEVRAVAESGVKGLEEARRLRRAGAANLLIGEALVRDPSLLKALREAGP